ncbi:integrase [Paraburkholderia sp. JPY465]|uniref:site-specific integrase n=1 Tax=Paraburkholderia sp. JPY465 TaxID=3042285 RepID=UPI003D1D8E63
MSVSRVINDLENVRYHTTYTDNEYARTLAKGWGHNEQPMTLTYHELISREKAIHQQHDVQTATDATVSQVMRNRLSTLNSYLTFNGKTLDSVVGREMLGDFDAKLKSYCDSLATSEHTKADRRSHLGAWRNAAQSMMAGHRQSLSGSTEVGERSSFNVALRHAIAAIGEDPVDLAKRAGASTATLKRWIKGAEPERRDLPAVHRLELCLGLEDNSLRSLIPSHSHPASASTEFNERAEIPYRTRLRKRCADAFRLKPADIGDSLAAEWQAFFDYKTAKHTQIERSQRGKWRLLPDDKVAVPASKYTQKRGRKCETADLNFNVLRGFLGFLARPAADGGFGCAPEKAQTLAWLAVPRAVDAFLEFLTERSDGLEHGGHAAFANLAGSVTHPVTGYLSQQPAFLECLPVDFAEAWQTMCKETHTLCTAWKHDAKGFSRNPAEPIQALLDLSEPLKPILRAIGELDRQAASAPTGGRREAEAKRDALLLSMLIANPLRNRNYVTMTWRNDNAGALYRRQDGQWRIRFNAPGDFKNDGHSNEKAYDAPLPRDLSPRIEEYLEEYRPRLVQSNPRAIWLFPNNKGEKWQTQNTHVANLMKRLVPETPGFGPHAFRHLVATDYLRKHPNDFLTVTVLLNDRLETVLKAYAHLRQDESFDRYEAYMRGSYR